jgi:hypothetical protein
MTKEIHVFPDGYTLYLADNLVGGDYYFTDQYGVGCSYFNPVIHDVEKMEFILSHYKKQLQESETLAYDTHSS